MKKFIAVLAAVSASAFLFTAQAAKPKAEVVEVTYQTNMHCDKCAKKISENIAFEKGVKGLEVSLSNKTVKITYDAKKTNPEKLKEALRKLGFPGEVVE